MIRTHNITTYCFRLMVLVLLLGGTSPLVADENTKDSVKVVFYAEEIYEGYLAGVRANNSEVSVLRNALKEMEEAGEDSIKLQEEQQKIDILKAEVDRKNIKLYQKAYMPWRYTIDNTPIKRIKHYTDGLTIIDALRSDTTQSKELRQTYADEMMALYDDWIQCADSINETVDNPFSKTYIRVRKATDYITIYGDKREEPYWRKAYQLIQEALNEPGDEVSNYNFNLYYRYDLYSDRLYRENMAEYAEQYQIDYELACKGLEDALAVMGNDSETRGNSMENAQSMLDQINEVFTANFRGSGNCDQDEATFMAQMMDNFMDEKFLQKVIVTMQYCDSSEVFVEALQNYLMYVDPSNVKYAKLLANKYYRQGRYDECLSYYQIAEKGEEDLLEKANIQFNMGVIYKTQNSLPKASRYIKLAIKNNPNYGDAYIQLAQIYADTSINWNTKPNINRLKFLVCIDKCELARQCIKKAQADASLRKYNRTPEATIDALIVSYKSNVPPTSEVFFEGGAKYTSGTLVLDKGLLRGEKTNIRFYD